MSGGNLGEGFHELEKNGGQWSLGQIGTGSKRTTSQDYNLWLGEFALLNQAALSIRNVPPELAASPERSEVWQRTGLKIGNELSRMAIDLSNRSKEGWSSYQIQQREQLLQSLRTVLLQAEGYWVYNATYIPGQINR